MQTFSSPGVYTENYSLNYSQLRPTAVRGAFAGNFAKGPINEAVLVTTIDELIRTFGTPTDDNYNDWFQVNNFLQYYPGCYVSRAANLDYDFETITTAPVTTVDIDHPTTKFKVGTEVKSKFQKYDRFTISGDNVGNGELYTLMDVEKFEFVPALRRDIFEGDQILKLHGITSASIEIPSTDTLPKALTPANTSFIESVDVFDTFKDTYSHNNAKTPLSIWARSPGSWGNQIHVAIVKPADFKVNFTSADVQTAKLAFTGHVVDNVFRKPLTENQIGVVVALGNQIVETFTCSANRNGADFIEDVINKKSAYILVKRGIGELYSTAFTSTQEDKSFTLVGGKDSPVGIDDIARATHVLDNKDWYEFDVLIGNELDGGMSAVALAMTRKDIVAVVGAGYDNFNSRVNSQIVSNLVDWRENVYITESGCICKDKIANSTALKSPYVVFAGNYYSIYDNYNDKQRMVNIAGDIAGLRAKTNNDSGVWAACAGYTRGVLRTPGKLVFNPTREHRDVLYVHGINPVCAIAGNGNILLGNRTLDNLESSFSSWHVRSLTNALSRSIEKMLRQHLMDNINEFTMNAITMSIQPLLHTVQAGGGIEVFEVRCDHTNNTPETRANNELHVDVLFKPTGVAEYIVLRLVNSGNESFTAVTDRLKYRQS